MAKFLLKNHFLSVCNNMTVKQHINHWAIQKVCHLHNGIFIPLTCVTLSQFYFITSLVMLVLPTKNNKLWNKRKEVFFVYVAASTYCVISKEVESRVFRRNRIFRHTCLYKQPILTKYWNCINFVQILYSYLRYTDRPLDGFFCFCCCC